MALESDLGLLLASLVDSRVYPDEAPGGVAAPYITYQQVGGRAGFYVENTLPSHRHARLQFNVWAKSRKEANAIASAIELRICESTLIAEPYGAFVSTYESAIKMYGTRQDFGFSYPR